MNVKKLLIAAVAAFIAVFAFEFLWHGFLMKGMYNDTMSVWRPQEESNMAVMFISQFLFALAMTWGYSLVGKSLTCKIGIQYGAITGLIVAMPQLATYSYLPIPISISLLWMLSCLLRGLLTGFVIAKIYTFNE